MNFHNFERHRNLVHGTSKRVKPIASVILLSLVLLLFFSIIRASLFTEIDEHKRIWFEVSFLMLTAVTAKLMVAYTRQPFVLVLLFLGMLLSPSFITFSWPFVSSAANTLLSLAPSLPQVPYAVPRIITANEAVQALAQLGALILLFKIGIHSEIKSVFSAKNFIVALFGVVVPFALGYWVGIAEGYSPPVALFMGAAFTATSIGVSVAILEEYRVLSSDFAKMLLGAAVIDDILGLLALSLVVNLSSSTTFAIGPVINVAAVAFVFLAGGIIVGRLLVANYFDKFFEQRLSTKVLLSALAFMLFYAFIAEMIGLSGIVGAFLAGLTLNYSKIKETLLEGLAPLEGFLTPIFFISLGILVDVNALYSFAVPILVFSAVAVFSKLAGCGAGALLTGLPLKSAAAVGIGMIPRGEVAFIIGLYGLSLKILSPAEYSVITAMAFVTTVITPTLLSKVIRSEKQGL